MLRDVKFLADEVALGQVSPSISASSANLFFTKYSTLFHHPGLVQQGK
jgi:hypothetical protein